MPIIPAETALPGCGCSREFTTSATVIEDEVVSTLLKDALRCSYYERFVAIAGESQYIGLGGQPLRESLGVLCLRLRSCVTASLRSFHRGEQVTLRSSLCICHQVIVKADYVMGEFGIKFHFGWAIRISKVPHISNCTMMGQPACEATRSWLARCGSGADPSRSSG